MTYQVFDTTLRDGAQREGITYSVVDKLAVARLLDDLGRRLHRGRLARCHAQGHRVLPAGPDRTGTAERHPGRVRLTRRADLKADKDPQIRALLDAETQAVCLVAKSDVRHVERALRTTREENLAMVRDTVAFFRRQGRRVFLDCEHFFDGFRFDPGYTTQVARPRWRPGPRSWSCATPTAACCPRW